MFIFMEDIYIPLLSALYDLRSNKCYDFQSGLFLEASLSTDIFVKMKN